MSHRTVSALQLAFLLVLASVLSSMPAFAASQARIVRLSDVQGTVQINKNTGLGFENAFLNLPITQGAQLKTGDTGRAEIEFEDGSTLRLAPKTTVRFSALGLDDAGKHQSSIELVEGMAYVNWVGKSGDRFDIVFSQETISLEKAAHFRVSASEESSNLSVFKGDVEVDGASGKVTVTKKQTATFAENDKPTVAKNIQEEPFDSWDKEAISYHDQYARNNSSPYGYGFSDLNYYGSYTNVAGYGMMWQPYFTGAGWDPFLDGAWSFYPGYGYMFVSAYPWGWMPYRYGNWMFVPGFGWMWQPGNWNSWVTVPRYTPTSTVHVTSLVPPTGGGVKTVVVGKGATLSTVAPTRVRLNAGSAGIGIARGSISNLHSLNRQVTKNGFAEVHAAPQFSATSPNRSIFGAPTSTAAPSSLAPSSASATRSAPAVHTSAPAPHASSGPHR